MLDDFQPPAEHVFNHDIRDVTLSGDLSISEDEAYRHIDQNIPDHEVLLAGFPCQSFSLAGVSKKNSLGRKHGFECNIQGTLFFDVARIITAKRPAVFLLENVKNLKSHDKDQTFKISARLWMNSVTRLQMLMHLRVETPRSSTLATLSLSIENASVLIAPLLK